MMKNGFTLIELILTVAFFSIFTTAVFFSFVVGLRVWDSGKIRANIRQDASLALERITRELSQAYSIQGAREDEITFWADAAGTEEITIDVQTGNLTRTLDALATILTPNVQTFTLSYRDLDDNSMNIPSDVGSQAKRDDIRIVGISLVLDEEDETITLGSSAYTRNQGL